MPRTLIYAGIGSRQTPEHILYQMVNIAEQLSNLWTLRSGHADGADLAFETGAITGNGKKEIFIPWFGFNEAPTKHPDYIRPRATEELASFSARFHPNWEKCTDLAKLLHMRNACQILGIDGDSPVDMVVCYTPHGRGTGGTGQALRIARAYEIPIFDLGASGDDVRQQLCEYVAFKENVALAS